MRASWRWRWAWPLGVLATYDPNQPAGSTETEEQALGHAGDAHHGSGQRGLAAGQGPGGLRAGGGLQLLHLVPPGRAEETDRAEHGPGGTEEPRAGRREVALHGAATGSGQLQAAGGRDRPAAQPAVRPGEPDGHGGRDGEQHRGGVAEQHEGPGLQRRYRRHGAQFRCGGEPDFEPAEDGLFPHGRDQGKRAGRDDQGHAGVSVHADLREGQVLKAGNVWATSGKCRASSSGWWWWPGRSWFRRGCTTPSSRASATTTWRRSRSWKPSRRRTRNWKPIGRSWPRLSASWPA